jgi:hypothetical protein
MDSKKLDALFRELEQVQTEGEGDITTEALTDPESALAQSSKPEEGRALGLGLTVVSRILRDMDGLLRLKSEKGKGSRFVLIIPFDLPEAGQEQSAIESGLANATVESPTPTAEVPTNHPSPSTPSNANEEITLVGRRSNKRSSDNSRLWKPGEDLRANR